MIAAVGLFDLRRPYFGFDSTNLFKQIGAVRSRGAEFSITGSVTKRLDVVAGGMKSRPCFRPLLAERMEVIVPPGHYDKVDF